MSYYDPFDDSGYDENATLEEVSPRERRKKRGKPSGLYNFISLVFLFASIGVIAGIVFVVRSPEPIALIPPRPTSTLIPFPFLTPGNEPTTAPTATAQPSPSPTETPIIAPTETPAPTATNISAANPTSTAALFPFVLVDNAITYEAYEDGCEYSGIAGQVLDVDGNAVDGLPIQVTGDEFEALVFSGSTPEAGPGGFEVPLADVAIEAEYRLQLLNTTGQAFSAPIIVRTLDSCERNVALVIFQQSANFEGR